MPCEVVFTASFEAEYDAVLNYQVHTLCAPSAARAFIDGIDEAVEALGATPKKNAVSRKAALGNLELREHLVRNYVVVYRIVAGQVVLEHLFHQRQDYARLI